MNGRTYVWDGTAWKQIDAEIASVVPSLAVTGNFSVGGGSVMPIGSIVPFAGASSPDATWLVCDGSAISRTTYAALFAVLGTTYGSGDGSTTFNIPNMKGRVPVGVDSGQTEFDALGETGGAKTHTLTESEMPSHTHIQNAHNHQGSWGQNYYAGGGISAVAVLPGLSANYTIGNATATNQNTGGGGAHNNLQPYMALNYIMKVA
ncbi:MAG: phage tail protein [Ilumatobacteraceae bacterium]